MLQIQHLSGTSSRKVYLQLLKLLERYRNISHVSSTCGLSYIAPLQCVDSQLCIGQAYPQETVGVFVQRGRGGPLSVVEYSEMDAAMATEINQSTGRLRYCWSNVCFYHLSQFL